MQLTEEEILKALEHYGEEIIVVENKEEKKDGRYLRREFSYSKFQQTMILPDNVDKEKISAQVENGVLAIELPKLSEEEIKKPERTIEIK